SGIQPWVHWRFRADEAARYEMHGEDDLRREETEGADRDERVHRLHFTEERVLRRIVDAAHVPMQAELVHREEGAVVEHEREPEVYFAPERVHHPPEHLRVPVRDGGEDREQTAAEQ